MAEKWHKNGIGNANDRGNKICYTDTVYKWVPGNLLVFLYDRKRRSLPYKTLRGMRIRAWGMVPLLRPHSAQECAGDTFYIIGKGV